MTNMKCTPIDVIEVKVLNDYNLYLKFDDGNYGTVDISQLVPFRGIFEPLKDRTFFTKVTINPDIGTICWSNGADLSPTYLYEHIKKN